MPFHQNSEQDSNASENDGARPAVPTGPKSAGGAPFRAATHSLALPAGLLMTVRLDDSISIFRAHPGDTFIASVAGPITIDGETVIEPGTPVIGRIESVHPSATRPGLSPDPGYLRLTLRAVSVEGRELVLQTSSLFAKGAIAPGVAPASAGMSAVSQSFRVLKGRRLTFRLTAPIQFAGRRTLAELQSSNSAR